MVIHWETIVTKVHSQTLMVMKSGCKMYTKNVTLHLNNLKIVILHVTVKDVAMFIILFLVCQTSHQ